jgi:hypothetical protein
MKYLNKLPNYIRYSSEREWHILKRMPMIAVLSTLVLMLPILQLRWQTAEWFPLDHQTSFVVLGLLFTLWFFIGVVCIGLVVMIIMKGPGYVADGYDLPKEDPALENKTRS